MKSKLIVAGVSIISMMFLASCAGEPAAMKVPELDKLAHQIVAGGDPSEKPTDKPTDKDKETDDPDGEVAGYKIPVKAHVESKMTGPDDDGGVMEITLSGDFDSSSGNELAELTQSSASAGGKESWILVDGDLYCASGGGVWEDCGSSDFLGEDVANGDLPASAYHQAITLARMDGLDEVLGALSKSDIKPAGEERINGVETTHVTAKDNSGTIDIWHDSKKQIVRFEMSGTASGDNISLRWDYTNIDEEVKITAPKTG